MIEKRWTLIEPPLSPSCSGAIVVSGAGTASVNGTYCPDVIPLVWTKVGGTIYEDSIYSDSAYGGFWVITSGGLASDDVSNIKYMDLSASGPQSPGSAWTGWAGSPTDITGLGDIIGGAAPAPSVMMGGAQAPDFDAPLSQWTAYRALNPANLVKFTEEEDLALGLIAKRRKLATDIVFTGEDYLFFLQYERRSGRCAPFYIRREWKCGGVWREVWTGVFSVGSGEWDHDLCQFSVRPDVYDRYTCIMQAMNNKVNILELPATEIKAVIWPGTIQVRVVPQGTWPPPPFPTPAQFGYDLVDTQTVTIPALGGLCGSPQNITFDIYWREYIERPCVDGSPVGPPGAGWVQEPQNNLECADEGVEAWVRQPVVAWPFTNDPIVVGPVGTSFAEPTSPECGMWLRVGEYSCLGTDNIVGLYVCVDSAEDFISLSRGRKLMDAAEYMITKSACSSAGIVSDFFEWNPPGDAPGYVAGQNYRTQSANQYDNLFILQKSDAIDPDASNPAVKGEWSLREFFEFMAKAFQVFWDIDDDGAIRLEHWTYWTFPVGLDLTQYDQKDVVDQRSYRYLSEEIPERERASWVEALGEDFKGADIVYSGPCVGQERRVQEYRIERITTDLGFVVGSPDEIDKDGFVVLACRFQDPDYWVILDYGALSSSLATNAPMSWANLQDAFWRDNRFLGAAEMNEENEVFDVFRPNIEQATVWLRSCCASIGLNTRNRALSRLSYFLDQSGVPGYIKKVVLDEDSDGMEVTIRYPR